MTSRPWRTGLNPALADLSVYDVPPADAPARLHANESPQTWSDQALDAAAAAVRAVELNRYPDTSGRRLRALLGRRHGVDAGRIVLGNGSDEIISILLTAFARPGGPAPRMVLPTPTFVMYAHCARVLGYEVTEVPLDAHLELRADAMREALRGAAVCFLARPNNPTSSLWDRELIAMLVAEYPETIFVIDEAYGAYAPGQSLFAADAPSNQVHMTTLSKIGLASLRLGYCVADPELAEALNKCRHPYNISATTLAVAETLLDRHGEELEQHLTENLRCRARLVAILSARSELEVFPAHGNLVLCRLRGGREPGHLTSTLADAGVLIKNVSAVPGLEGCLRISIGTATELDLLERCLPRALA